MLSPKIKNIALSGTIEITAKTIEMKSKGLEVFDLCAGESDLATPNHIKEAAIKAITENKTKYTINTGIRELREAICAKYKTEYNSIYDMDEVIVSTGAKQAIYNALQAVIGVGDEVILPLPYYVSYPPMIELAGGTPVYVRTETSNSYKITKNELNQSITRNTKAIILCNPNNPSGSVYTRKELLDILEIVSLNNLILIADEIYEKLVYDNIEFTSIASFGEKYKNNVIIINGVSKAYSMTGWRIGYAVAPKEIIIGMSKLQSHSTSNACTISQYAALAAITSNYDTVNEQCKIFESRRALVHQAITRIKDLDFIEPRGAFYFFINIKKVLDKSSTINNSKEFCLKLLEEGHVATVPGTVFGMEGYIRVAYTKSKEELEGAMKRIKEFVEQIM